MHLLTSIITCDRSESVKIDMCTVFIDYIYYSFKHSKNKAVAIFSVNGSLPFEPIL